MATGDRDALANGWRRAVAAEELACTRGVLERFGIDAYLGDC